MIPQSCFCTAACDMLNRKNSKNSMSKVYMIKRIIILLKILSKMNNLFYIYWDWSNRFLFILFWHLIILITSRDCNHITWFCRNSASVSLLATLSHRTWIANDFFIISTFSKAIETLKLHFLKIFLQTKIFFFTHLLYAKSTFNSDRRLYKKKWCDLMRIWSFNFY